MSMQEEINAIIHSLNRKLLLIEGERKAIKRKEIIDSILLDEDGEIKQLKQILKI